jgi:hypothetical protein
MMMVEDTAVARSKSLWIQGIQGLVHFVVAPIEDNWTNTVDRNIGS